VIRRQLFNLGKCLSTLFSTRNALGLRVPYTSCRQSLFMELTPTSSGAKLLGHVPTNYNSSLGFPPSKSGIFMILTTKLVHPVKCCVLCPLPVSGLYCSHAKPVSFQLSYTVLTRFLRSAEYIFVARAWCGPFCWATVWRTC
jgi:hypothetical protein